MNQLIEIQSVPISVEFKVTPASTQRREISTELSITRKSNGGLRIESKPIRLQVDSFESRNSVVPTAMTSMKQFGAESRQAGFDATAKIAAEGEMLVNIHLNQDPLRQIAEQSMPYSGPTEVNIKFIPEVPPEINWEPGSIKINYAMDKLNFDWRPSQTDFEFIPGDIEFVIKQYPKIVFKYTGEPIYVPASANPNYRPVDAKG